jgi:hypothetical protein
MAAVGQSVNNVILALVVVMSESHARCQVVTIDRKDFSVYRRHDRQAIDFVAPPR